jgi:cobalamin biosynthesis protein CbiD
MSVSPFKQLAPVQLFSSPSENDGKKTGTIATAAAKAAPEHLNNPDLQNKAIPEALGHTAGHIQVSRDFIGSINSTRLPPGDDFVCHNATPN